jgi:hypothetical protein
LDANKVPETSFARERCLQSLRLEEPHHHCTPTSPSCGGFLCEGR